MNLFQTNFIEPQPELIDSCQQSSQDPLPFRQAQKHYECHHYSQAIPIFQSLIEKYNRAQKISAIEDLKQLCKMRYFLGNCFYHLNMIPEAISNFNYIYSSNIESKSRTAERYNNLGCCYGCSQQYSKAFDCFKIALPLYLQTDKKGLPNLYLNIAHLYELNQMYEEAVENYKVSLQMAEVQTFNYFVKNQEFRNNVVYLMIRCINKSDKGLHLFKQNQVKIISYLYNGNKMLQKISVLNLKIQTVKIFLLDGRIQEACKILQEIENFNEQQNQKILNLNLIKANTYYQTADYFMKINKQHRCLKLLQTAKRCYSQHLKNQEKIDVKQKLAHKLKKTVKILI